MIYEQVERNELILRDTLAIDRTRLANQRTLLAFVRTGLYLIVTALAIFEFTHAGTRSWPAWILIVVGGAVIVGGFLNYLYMRHKIERSYNAQGERV